MNNHQHQLNQLRQEIDSLDTQLISLLSRRVNVAIQIGRLKHRHQINPLDSKRWKQVLVSRIALGESVGLPESFIVAIFDCIHHHSLSVQQKEQQ